MALVTTIGGNAAGLISACEQSKRSLDGLSRYSAITGRNFKKMSGLIDSAVGSLGNLTSALSSGDFTGAAQAIQNMTLSTKGFTSILGKANPTVASFVKNMGGLLGKIGLIGGLLGLLGKGISDAVSKARELRAQKFSEEWDKQHVALTKYSGEIADHIVNLENLKAKVHDNTLSLKERKKAIQDIQAIVPEYTASISNEGRVTKENTTALTNYINKLFQYYTTLAWKDKWIEMIKKGIDAQLELEKATKKVQDAQKGVDDMNKNYDNSFFASGPGATAGGSWMGSGQDIALHSTVANLENVKKEQKKAQQKLDEVNKKQENLKNHYQESVKAIGDFNPDGPKTTKGGKGGGGKTTPIEINTQPLVIKGDREGPILDSLFPKSIEAMDARIKAYTDLYNKAQDDVTRQLARSKIEYWKKQKDIMENGQIQPIKMDMPKLEFDNNEFASEVDGWSEKLKSKLLDLHIAFKEEGTIDYSQYEAGVEKLKNLNDAVNEINSDGLNKLADGFGNMGNAIAGFGGESAQAIGTMMSSIGQLFAMIGQVVAMGGAQALADALKVPFPGNIGAIATVMGLIASVTSTISSLAGMKFAQGGIVGGGSYTGDKVMAAVNSGEMILNRTQQAHLFRMVNNQTKPNTWEHQEVVFKIRGKQLIGVLSNQDKINNKI